MFKTLLALVVSMTGTTALLGWIDPSAGIAEQASTIDDVIPAAREVVASGLDARHASWTAIEIAVTPSVGDPGVWLAASSGPRDHHFSIDHAGRIMSTEAWRTQARAADKGTSLVVHLLAVEPGAGPTEAQIAATRALVGVLDDMVPRSGAPLPVNAQLN